jgi:hypothetical protein
LLWEGLEQAREAPSRQSIQEALQAMEAHSQAQGNQLRRVHGVLERYGEVYSSMTHGHLQGQQLQQQQQQALSRSGY